MTSKHGSNAPQPCVDAQAQSDGKLPCSQCQDHIAPSAPLPPQSHHEAEVSNSPGPVNAQDRSVSLSIGEITSPSLSVRSISLQQTKVFTDYVLSSFPCYFRCTSNRVPFNWLHYVEGRRGSMNTCFDWAICACTTAYTGALYNDSRYSDAARALYIRALRSLARLLSDASTAELDEAMATAIVLSIFEIQNCSDSESWTQHAAGIRTLMRLRGPQVHVHGFGRAMYIVYRHILITAALVAGEECFLQEPEWRELNDEIAADNAKQPDSSVYSDITERGFGEITQVPAYVKRAQELLAMPSSKKKRTLQSVLLREVQATRAALRGIHTEFSIAVSMLSAGKEGQEGFIGPLPYHFFDGFNAHYIKGIRSALLILNNLIVTMDQKQRAAIEAENRTLSDGMSSLLRRRLEPSKSPRTLLTTPTQPKLVVWSLIVPDTKEAPTTDLMDRLITSTGMDGVQVNLIELTQSS